MKQKDNIKCLLRDFTINDSQAVNQIALLAFQQYENYYNDWNKIKESISSMASLADHAELIVASSNENIIGAVAYVPSGIDKALFPKDWPVIRMLVVDPQYRGLGIGKKLTEACIQRALRDDAKLIALHTSSIMEIALKMYLRMGFVFEKEAPLLYGVTYNIYIKHLPTPL